MILRNMLDYEKIEILDRLISVTTIEELKAITEQKEVVSKLKKDDTTQGFITDIITSHNELYSNMVALNRDVEDLRADLKKLIYALNTTAFSYSREFNDLKQKNNVY